MAKRKEVYCLIFSQNFLEKKYIRFSHGQHSLKDTRSATKNRKESKKQTHSTILVIYETINQISNESSCCIVEYAEKRALKSYQIFYCLKSDQVDTWRIRVPTVIWPWRALMLFFSIKNFKTWYKNHGRVNDVTWGSSLQSKLGKHKRYSKETIK